MKALTQSAAAVAGPPTRKLGLIDFSARAVWSYSSKYVCCLGFSRPEVNIGFVPILEIPLRNFLRTVTLDEVLGEVTDQVITFRVVFWRKDILFVPERMDGLPRRQLARHETDLDERPHSVFEQPVVNLADIRKVVNRIAVFSFIVNAQFVMKDGVEADILEVGRLLHLAKIAAIAVPKRKKRPAGTECFSQK